MICTNAVTLLPEYVRRRLPATQAAAVRSHLSQCPSCAAAYEAELAFGAMVHDTDAPAPAELLAHVMATVRAEPRRAVPFRLRMLDFVFAIGAALAAGGLAVGLLSLWRISPFLTGLVNLGALLDDGLTVRAITLAALWAVVGLAVCIPLAAALYAIIVRSSRAPLGWGKS